MYIECALYALLDYNLFTIHVSLHNWWAIVRYAEHSIILQLFHKL